MLTVNNRVRPFRLYPGNQNTVKLWEEAPGRDPLLDDFRVASIGALV